MSAAKNPSGSCDEVHRRQRLSRESSKARSALEPGSTPWTAPANFAVIASGVSPRGFEIWNVSSPSSPTRVMEGLTGEPVYSVAMWQEGSTSYFLATRGPKPRDGSTTSAASPAAAAPSVPPSGPRISRARALPSSPSPGATRFPFSTSAVRPATARPEIRTSGFYDVSDPSSPTDISPQGTVVINGEAGELLGLVLPVERDPRLQPRRPSHGQVLQGDYFFRAAFSIFDIHRRTGASPPVVQRSASRLRRSTPARRSTSRISPPADRRAGIGTFYRTGSLRPRRSRIRPASSFRPSAPRP